MSIAVGWLLSGSLSVSDVLFMLVIRAVAVGWQLYVALLVDVVLFGMYFVGSLSAFDVLLLLVSMVGAWMWAGECRAVCVGGCISCRGAAVMGCVEIGGRAVRVGVVEFVNVVCWRATWVGSLGSR